MTPRFIPILALTTLIGGAAALTAGASAQSAQPGAVAPPPASAPLAAAGDPGAPPAPRGPGAMADDVGPPPPGGPEGPRGHRPPPPPSKAARFHVERGDLRLDIKCAEDEPMKSCADLALQMLDRLQARP